MKKSSLPILLTAVSLFCATLPVRAENAPKAAPANSAPAASSPATSVANDATDLGPASRIERALLEINEDQEKLFHGMEQGEMTQDDFERRAVDLSTRYDELVSRDPNNVDVLILYGKFLRRVGQNDQANVLFSHADKLSPNLAVLKQQLGNYLAEQGNYPEALAYYMKAIDLEPKEAVYHYGLGELLATFRDKFVADGAFTDDAIDVQTLSAFAKSTELAPGNKDFAFRHAEAYYDIKKPRWEEALALWTQISERKDLTRYEKDAARLHMARINCELGRNKEALALVREETVPVLMATRARLLKRINSETTRAEDKANAAVLAPAPEPVAPQAASNPAPMSASPVVGKSAAASSPATSAAK